MSQIARNSFRLTRHLLFSHLHRASSQSGGAVNVPGILSRYFAKETFAPQNTSKALKTQNKDGSTKDREKITLLGVDNSITITTLDDAQKLAKRRDLVVVKENHLDSKTQRPTYRLKTISKVKQEEISESAQTSDTNSASKLQIKGDKLLNISNKIAENDLQSRLKHVQKWLVKHYKVVVVVSGSSSDMATSERIFKEMEDCSKGLGRILQKRVKNNDIKFHILPIAQPPSERASSSSSPAA